MNGKTLLEQVREAEEAVRSKLERARHYRQEASDADYEVGLARTRLADLNAMLECQMDRDGGSGDAQEGGEQ